MANTVDKVLAIALAEVGYLEKKSDSQLESKTANAGTNNYTKYGKEMHQLYPSVMDYPASWCDSFIDWCFYKAYGVTNAKGLLGGDFNDYTVASAQLYKNKGAWYTSNPKVGDQIFFKNSTRIHHTGLVYAVDSKYVYTIEGNTSGGSTVIANGGAVCKKKYLLTNSKIAGYGRPKYDVVAKNPYTEPTTTLKSGAKGEGVKWLQWELNQSGAKLTIDGSFGPATLAAVKAYQKSHNLTVDGIVGPATRKSLKDN